jgi:hypothetical protein
VAAKVMPATANTAAIAPKIRDFIMWFLPDIPWALLAGFFLPPAHLLRCSGKVKA